MTSDNKKAPKSSRRRKLVLALAVLTVVTLAAFATTWVWLESRAGQERVRLMLERRVSAALGRPLDIGALEFDLLPLRASLADVTVGGGAGADQPLLRVPGVRVQLDPWALMAREILLESLELDEPTVHWDIPDGEAPPTRAAAERRSGIHVEHRPAQRLWRCGRAQSPALEHRYGVGRSRGRHAPGRQCSVAATPRRPRCA